MNIHQMISRSLLSLLAWCTLAAAPTFAQVTILHVPLFTFDGGSEDDLFGQSVNGAGDVNGDGFADLIVGAPRDRNNGTDRGSAQVFSGSDGSVLFTFDGETIGDGFGSSVSSAGDVNGDGFAGLIVGAPFENNGSRSGSARVFSGSDGSVLFTFDGETIGGESGVSVSGAGDVSGDGFADLIVGAQFIDSNGARGGSARVFSGSDGSVLFDLDRDSIGDVSVSGAGDINGDGVADLIVGNGARGVNNGGYARVLVSEIIINILGDANLDGVVNFLDISAFISVLSSGAYLEEADCNEDGVLNFLDIPSFIAILNM